MILPLAASLGVELTKGGRIVVNSDLSVPGHPEVYAIGENGEESLCATLLGTARNIKPPAPTAAG